MAEDITAMKETLLAQQQLLQKLYAELDEEREASATAASEAMDMILRLQGEKAAVKMEASHYKRVAEEKIEHAESTLEVFEELLNQKEMEISSLEFQVLAYKNKLLALGSDFNASDFEFPEDLLLSRNDQYNEENGQGISNVRRLSSLPPIQFKSSLRAARKRDRSPSPVPFIDLPLLPPDQDVASPSLDLPSTGHGTLDAFWNQIKTLDEKVKVISDCKESGGEKCLTLRNRRGRSCSIFSQTGRVAPFSSDKVDHSEGTENRESVAIPSCSINVHDVFEVPQTSEKHKAIEHGKKRLVRWISDADNRLTKPDSLAEEILEPHVKHDLNKLKSILSGNHETKIVSSKEMKTIVRQRKDGMDVECNAQAEFQKLHQRIDQLQRETIRVRREIKHEVNGEERLRLLKDINNQIKILQSEMRSWKTKNTPPKRDVSLDPLQEVPNFYEQAMVCLSC
ncbi:Myosin-binding protein 7, partial [Mucuna pruriens]